MTNKGDTGSIFDKFDLICDEFDRMWANNCSPEIEDFLNRVEKQNHRLLLEYLIPIDVEYRIKANLVCRKEDYRKFGTDAEEIATKATEDQSCTDLMKHPTICAPHIEGHRIVRHIGQGGMGTVFLAEQEKPVKRMVAIKVVNARHDSDEIVSRFEGERQALALMDHPFIARIFEAGATESGIPYFTMEWVGGKPIDTFCDSHELNINQRIELLVKVCSAVQHAHQKGVIHRDLKPSNILVVESEGKAIPKVIDFGLAKALGDQVRLTDRTANTGFGAIVGTLRYMSPEQADADLAAVDTRTDIYSLGAIAYELLTGTTPLELEKVESSRPWKALELVRTNNVQRPSSRLRTSDEAGKPVPVRCSTSMPRLQQMFRNELDWLVLKALDGDPDRRYKTVESLQKDLRRFLSNEPIQARPPSAWYLFRKTAQKHWLSFAATALFVLMLVATSLVIIRLYLNERSARLEAERTTARARFFAATALSAQNRPYEATVVLDTIDPKYRFLEWQLARENIEGNYITFSDSQVDHSYVAAISPDGQLVASGGELRPLVIRKADSNEIVTEIRKFKQPFPVSAIIFHPTKNWIAFGGIETIQIWDFDAGILIHEFRWPKVPVRTLHFSHDGNLLAAGGGQVPQSANPNQDDRIRIWNLKHLSDKPIILNGHTACVTGISFSPDNSTIVSSGYDKAIRSWNVQTGLEIQHQEFESYVMSICYSPNGETVACGTADNQLSLWSIDSGKMEQKWVVRKAHAHEGVTIKCLAFKSDGKLLATGGFDRQIKLWNVELKDLERNLLGHFEEIVNVEFIPQTNQLFSVSPEGVYKIWDLERESETRVLKGHTQSVTAISFSGDNRWLLSAGGDHPFDLGPNAPENTIGRIQDNSIRLWNPRQGNFVAVFKSHTDTVTDVEFDPISKSGDYFVSCSVDGSIRFWHRDQTEPVFILKKPHNGMPVNAIAFHPQERKLVSVGDDCFVRVWDIDSKKLIHAFSGHQFPVKCVAWNRDGSMIASGGRENNFGETIVWNTETWSGTSMWRVPSNEQKQHPMILSLAFSDDGSMLVTGGETMNVYKARTGEKVPTPKHSRLGLYFVDFLPDSKVPRLIVGGREGQVWLWDSKLWEELMVLKIIANCRWNFIYDGKFSPDGTMIATANRDGTVRIWASSRQSD